MIFNKQGVPLNEVLLATALLKAESLVKPRRKSWHMPKYPGAILRAIRKARGVGRPIKSEVSAVWIDEEATLPSLVVTDDAAGSWSVDATIEARPMEEFFTGPTYADAVRYHGSQRKAAAALGVSLGKLQRGIRKAA